MNTTTNAYARQIDADGIDGNAQQTIDAGSVLKGTLVQLKHGGPYYVAAGYDRAERKYCFDKHDDASKCRYLKKTAQVWAD